MRVEEPLTSRKRAKWTQRLNRLQEIMNIFDFDIIYKKGTEMPDDHVSHNLIGTIL
jgi:hypothetical protein